MIDKNNSSEKGKELFGECLAAMLYSDEEIRETMSPEDADEFIKLRNDLANSNSSAESFVGKYDATEDECLPLAAEEEEKYE